MVTGKSARQWLARQGVPLDFQSARPLRHIHRRLPDADVYFVANGGSESFETACYFRVTGKQPELWHPETGRITPLVAYEERQGRTPRAAPLWARRVRVRRLPSRGGRAGQAAWSPSRATGRNCWAKPRVGRSPAAICLPSTCCVRKSRSRALTSSGPPPGGGAKSPCRHAGLVAGRWPLGSAIPGRLGAPSGSRLRG